MLSLHKALNDCSWTYVKCSMRFIDTDRPVRQRQRNFWQIKRIVFRNWNQIEKESICIRSTSETAPW